jgi:predicted nucleic acid-binding protein
VDACTSTEVLQEVFYRYASLGRPDLALEVYHLFVEVCPIVFRVTLADTEARDAVHAAVVLNNDVEWIATFDAGFDEIPRIRRMKLS